MRNWIKKFIQFNILLGFLFTVLSSTVFGMEEQINRAVVFPIDYKGKAFINGEYVSFNGDEKIYLKDNTTYVPLRLMTYLISNDEEHWEAQWDGAKPNEVVLVCTYMEKIDQGGWMNTGKPQTSIKLTVDSKTMISKGQMIELSATPKKINGRIVLPIRAIGEVLNREIAFKDGLIFISKEPLKLNDKQADAIINEIKERFWDTSKKVKKYKVVEDDEELIAAQNVNGKTYFNVVGYNSSSQIWIQKLYTQGEKGPVLLKEIKNYVSVREPFVENVFYYGEEKQGQVVLNEYNLNTKQTRQIGELDIKGHDFSAIVKIIPKENKIYFIAHYGDYTMGGETLYVVENGKVEELTGAKQFGSIIIENGKIYYSNINFMGNPTNNLFEYDENSRTEKRLGEEGYTYDVNRRETLYSVANSLKLLENKLYTLGYLEQSDQLPCLYSIDLQTGATKKLSLPTSQFWIVNDKIYYIEATAQTLITIDLEGNGKKTLINKPIAQAKFNGKSFYYTLLSNNNDLAAGFYKYTLDTNETASLSSKRVKDFYIGSSKIGYITTGYDAGIYLIQDGKTIGIEKDPAYDYLFAGEQMIIINVKDNKLEILK